MVCTYYFYIGIFKGYVKGKKRMYITERIEQDDFGSGN